MAVRGLGYAVNGICKMEGGPEGMVFTAGSLRWLAGGVGIISGTRHG